MRTIIAGSRSILDMEYLQAAIAACNFNISHIISGGAKGVDALAIEYAKANNIPCDIYEAQWLRYGRGAGPIRNEQMITEGKAEALLAIWDGQSTGTGHMIRTAHKYRLLVHVETYDII